MTTADYTGKVSYFTDLLGLQMLYLEVAEKWGFNRKLTDLTTLKKAFIYLNTLSRYSPESSNGICPEQAEFIFTQLGKLLQ